MKIIVILVLFACFFDGMFAMRGRGNGDRENKPIV